MKRTIRVGLTTLALTAAAGLALAQTPAPTKPAAPMTTAPAAPAAPAAPSPSKTAPPPAEAAGEPTFPTAISDKYSKETPGKARMHTCRDQYKENKASNANGGLKWIQKGGGYYKACNAKLKG